MNGAGILFYLREDKLDLPLTPRVELEDDLARQEVRREPLIVALPEQHRLASAPRIDLAELRDERFQGWPTTVAPGYNAAVLAACHAAGFDPRVDDTSTGSTAWNNIAAGRGVALVVASAAPHVPRGIALVRLASPEAHIIPRRAVAPRQRPPSRPAPNPDHASRERTTQVALDATRSFPASVNTISRAPS